MPADDRSEVSPRTGHSYSDAKYAVPLALHVVDRSRLHDRLDAGSESPVTLLSAPAGWGKTLLVSSWLRSRWAAGLTAWVSLGPDDNDPRAFWRAVATSLEAVVGAPADALLRRVAADQGPVALLPGLVTDAMRHVAVPTILVLDNLHEITSLEVHADLVTMIKVPVVGLRLIVTTRRDPPWPPHRLRLAGLVTEVRAAELAFVMEEARELFAQLGMELAAAQLGLLLQKTEGWAAGLRLAALPLREPGVDVAACIESFSGDDRTVTAYLLDEVLEPQSAPVQRFLQKICILELVCADLADAVTGDGGGAEMLAELSSSNLFVQPVGASGHWFRLHGLVGDVLRGRMIESRARRDLHRRAAEWHRRQSLPGPAIQLALRGGLLTLAAEIVGIHVVELVLRGRGRELETMLAAIDRDSLLAHPELAAGLAAARLVRGQGLGVPELIDAAAARIGVLPTPRARRVQLILDLIGLPLARLRSDLYGLAAACRRIPLDPAELAELGLARWDLIRTMTLSNRGTAELWLGELDEAAAHLRSATEVQPADGVVMPHLNAQAHLALLECERGDLTTAKDHGHEAAARATAAGSARTVQVASAYLALAWLHLDRGEFSETDRWLRAVEEVEEAAPEPHIQLVAAVLHAHRRADADPDAALRGLQASTPSPAVSILPERLRDRSLLGQVEIAEQLRDPGRARTALAGLHAPLAPEAVVATAGVHLLERNPEGAEQHLATLDTERSTLRVQVTTDILWALTAAAREEDEQALRALERALCTAAPQRLRRPFTHRAGDLRELLGRRSAAGTGAAAFVVELLESMSGDDHSPRDATRPSPVPLTPRETTILRYLASTLTNLEIATELSVSVNTVKTHQQTAYRKLGVAGRREAVRRARELRLL